MGYPVVPALFVIALVALVVNTFIELPVESLVGLAIIALGLPAYRYWAGESAPDAVITFDDEPDKRVAGTSNT